MILTDVKGNEIREIYYTSFDFDMGDSMDFTIEMPATEYKKDLTMGARVFIPDTEYGGIIGGIYTNAEMGIVKLTGHTWRGLLSKKVICPAKGQDFRTASGELNGIIDLFMKEFEISSLFVSAAVNQIVVKDYQFERYCTFYDGIQKLLKAYGHKLVLNYVRGEYGLPGYVQIESSLIMDYSEKIEISQNSQIYFSIESLRDRTNHLICLGRGELKDRTRVDLFVTKEGKISQTQQDYFGLNEIVDVYDYPNVESKDELIAHGTDRLRDMMNSQTLNMDVYSTEFSALIGDIVGGRDYITGIKMSQPIIDIIYKEEKGISSIAYVVEGDVAGSYEFEIVEDGDQDNPDGDKYSFTGEALSEFKAGTSAIFRCYANMSEFDLENTMVSYSWQGLELTARNVITDPQNVEAVDYHFDIAEDVQIGICPLIFTDGLKKASLEVEIVA